MLRLRPYKKCDAKYIVSWLKEEDTFYKWSAGRLGTFPIEAETLIRHYEEQDYADNFFPMTALDGDRVVGHLLMRFPTADTSVLRFGFVVVDNSLRGKGYGRQLIEIALHYAFNILQVEKVTIGVFSNNAPAIACYTKAGFQDTGITEEYDICGQTWQCLELEINKR